MNKLNPVNCPGCKAAVDTLDRTLHRHIIEACPEYANLTLTERQLIGYNFGDYRDG